ncbi:hypothetical protein [Stenotrophomonas bentonitica]|uniref:hypothetical protein n=1 Tax=Stenotrophomonas bentonitica TaxID=1450134 RepID=UPI00345E59C6
MYQLFQFLSSAVVGAMVYLIIVAFDYWKRLAWVFGHWDPNLGHETEEKLISQAHLMAFAAAVFWAIWAFDGPAAYRRSWQVEVGLAVGMLIAYVVLLTKASSRAAAKQR